MMWQTQVLIIVITMTVMAVGAFKKRDVVSSNADIASYRRARSQNFFLDQSFIDKTIDQQTLPAISARDQTIGRQAPRDVSSKDQPVYSSSFPIFHRQPFKQDSLMVASLRNEPLFRDAVLRNEALRGERAILKGYPFEGQSLTSDEICKGQTSTYRGQAPIEEQLFTAETSFKNLFHGPSGEQAPFQKQAALVEFPPVSDSIKFCRNDYDKPIDSYGRHKNIQTPSGGTSMYSGNDAIRLPSMPMISSSKQLPPLNAEIMMPTMPSSASIPVHGSPVSFVSSDIDEAHSSGTSKMKLGPTTLGTTTSMSGSNCNAPVDGSPKTAPSISVSTNQSSIVGHLLTSLTTKPSSLVMSTATSIAPLVGNTLEPIRFHATKHGAVVTSSLPIQNELKSNVHAYLFPHTPGSSLGIDEHELKFLMPEAVKNKMKADTQSPMLNYILPEEGKSELKDIQNPFANYALPERLRHDWPSQQSPQPETPSGYTPLSLNGKTKFVLPSLSVAPISTISWPIEIKNDVSTMLPLKSIMTYDTATSNNLPLGLDLPLDFMTSIPNSLTSSIPNSIFGSITGGISTDIPSGMTTDMPASIPTLNLGQSLHHVEQLRQTQEARKPWYPTGLQLQLGGFGGINYTLHTGNPDTRPMELGNAVASLTPPKLSQPHAPAFAKIGVEYHL